jgi:hypothetical protein
MKKKILSIMLVTVMVAAMIPFGAIFASADAPTYAADTVALVNGTEVKADGLQAAIDAAPIGGTIDIVKDFAITQLSFAKAADGYQKEWKINGNGKTITSTSTATKIGSDTTYLMTFKEVTVEIDSLKLVTPANGVQVNSFANVTLKNCEIYTGGTKAGLSIEAATRPDAEITGGTTALNVNSYYAKLTVDGGTYKAYGPGGYVANVKGTANFLAGNFVGEDTSFVVRATNDNKTDMAQVQTVMNIYSGLYIKPVINRNTTKPVNNKNEVPVSDGGVLRADKGAIANIYGGQFANLSDIVKKNGEYVEGSQKRDYLLLTGESSNGGFIHIFGGDFYSFMTANVNTGASQLIGSFAGHDATVGSKAHSQLNFFIYGGNFYSSVPTREYNVKAIADKTADNLNRVSVDMYTATTAENQTVTVYGQEYTGVTKWALTYAQPTEAPADATVKVTTADNKVYYLKDTSVTGTYDKAPTYTAPAFTQAINAVAQNGSTIELLSDITIAQAEILNRDLTVTIDGKSKTLTLTGAKGLIATSGDITIKDLKIVASASTYAVGAGYSAANTLKLKLTLQNCDLTSSAAETVITVIGIYQGTIKAEGLKVAGVAAENVDIKVCAHIWEDTTEVTPATHAGPGVMGIKCSKCNETSTREIPQQSHEYTTIAPFDDTQHKLVCSCSNDVFELERHDHADTWTSTGDAKHAKACECGHTIEADHVWNDGEVTTEPTVEAEGVKTFTCADCGATKTEAIAKLDPPAADAPATDDAPAADAPATDAPAADADDKGCGSAIGIGAVAVLAVAGLACGVVSKKRED